MDIIIRLAKSSDAAELHILNELFNGEGCNSAENIEKFLKQNNQEIVCVATDGKSLFGFCCGQVLKSMCYSEKHGEITELFVLEEHRRQGIAKKLILFLEREFYRQEVNDIHVLTGNDNIEALGLYKACGYEENDEMMLEKTMAIPHP